MHTEHCRYTSCFTVSDILQQVLTVVRPCSSLEMEGRKEKDFFFFFLMTKQLLAIKRMLYHILGLFTISVQQGQKILHSGSFDQCLALDKLSKTCIAFFGKKKEKKKRNRTQNN